MGNVNANNNGTTPSSSSSEEEEQEEASSGTLPPEPPELMGQSPPTSPRATHSPFIFTPQVSSFFSINTFVGFLLNPFYPFPFFIVWSGKSMIKVKHQQFTWVLIECCYVSVPQSLRSRQNLGPEFCTKLRALDRRCFVFLLTKNK